MKQIYALFLFVCCLACTEDKQSTEYPSTPEAVVKEYQDHIDKNEFEAAKKFSTKEERARLSMVEEIIAGEPMDSTVFTTNFIAISCEMKDQIAICACIIEDFEERYRDTFLLVNQKGRWLVDVPQEEISYDHNEEIEQFVQEELEKTKE